MTAAPAAASPPSGKDAEDPEARFLALYDSLFDRLMAEVLTACEGRVKWAGRVLAALTAALDFLAREPGSARVLTVDALQSGPAALARHHASVRRLAATLEPGRQYTPRAARLPALAERVLIDGVIGAIAERAYADDEGSLPDLTLELAELALLPYLGATEARRALAEELRWRAQLGILSEAAAYRPLPAGRHGIPPQVIAEHMRRRLFVALVEELLESGNLAHISVLRVVDRAGVSKQTFYDHFTDKRECLLCAYDDARQRLRTRIVRFASPQPDRPAKVRAAIAAALAFFAAEPTTVFLLTSEGPAVDPALADRHREDVQRLATELRAARQDSTLPPEAAAELVASIAAMLQSAARSGEPERLLQLEPQMVELILTPYEPSASPEPPPAVT